jgi:hypothetical protein
VEEKHKPCGPAEGSKYRLDPVGLLGYFLCTASTTFVVAGIGYITAGQQLAVGLGLVVVLVAIALPVIGLLLPHKPPLVVSLDTYIARTRTRWPTHDEPPDTA